MSSLDFLFDFIVSKDNPLTTNLQPLHHPATSSPRPLELRMPGRSSTRSACVRPPHLHHHHNHHQPPTHPPPHLNNFNAHLPPLENDPTAFPSLPSQIPLHWLPNPHNAHWQDGLYAPPHPHPYPHPYPYPLPCNHHPDQLCSCANAYTSSMDDCSFGWRESLIWGDDEQFQQQNQLGQMECLDGYEYGADGQSGVVGVVYYVDPDLENVMGYGGGGGYAVSAGELGGLQRERDGGFVLRSVGTPDAERGMLQR